MHPGAQILTDKLLKTPSLALYFMHPGAQILTEKLLKNTFSGIVLHASGRSNP
jgi:L-asparaginase/Glu-tRNA(Gln) amidotransferase subunit D